MTLKTNQLLAALPLLALCVGVAYAAGEQPCRTPVCDTEPGAEGPAIFGMAEPGEWGLENRIDVRHAVQPSSDISVASCCTNIQAVPFTSCWNDDPSASRHWSKPGLDERIYAIYDRLGDEDYTRFYRPGPRCEPNWVSELHASHDYICYTVSGDADLRVPGSYPITVEFRNAPDPKTCKTKVEDTQHPTATVNIQVVRRLPPDNGCLPPGHLISSSPPNTFVEYRENDSMSYTIHRLTWMVYWKLMEKGPQAGCRGTIENSQGTEWGWSVGITSIPLPLLTQLLGLDGEFSYEHMDAKEITTGCPSMDCYMVQRLRYARTLKITDNWTYWRISGGLAVPQDSGCDETEAGKKPILANEYNTCCYSVDGADFIP